ncbi:fused MFS/spermidine synthase [bacterium]|nr:fused MFS/spermidine synthase [bacterium]
MVSSRRTAFASLIVCGCFFVSGASSLIYEVVWTRMLVLVFGSTTFAISTVLTAFMAGLALGSLLLGRAADRRGSPLLIYALLEAVIGIYALFIPAIFSSLTPIYKYVWLHFEPSFYLFSLIRFALVFIVLVIPATCMGATLPVLAKYYARRWERLGFSIGMLYALNTFGAVAGTVGAGFLLIPNLGVRWTIWIASCLNLLLAAVVLLAQKIATDREVVGHKAKQVSLSGQESLLPRRTTIAVLACFAASGAAAMIYEVAWSRLLSLIIGPSVYAFSIMLATFLVGLAVGSAIISLLIDRLRLHSLTVFLLLEIGVAVGSYFTLFGFGKLPYWFTVLFKRIDPASPMIFIIQMLVCFMVMLVPTLFLGGVFPAVVRGCAGNLVHISRSTGKIYAVNTFGAIVGSFATGFLLIPALGIQPTIMVGISINLLIAGILLLAHPFSRAVLTRVCLGLILLAGLVAYIWQPNWNKLLMSSGMYYYANQINRLSQESFYRFTEGNYNLLYYKEGITTTVTVARDKNSTNIWLATNGKIDASSESDMPTQVLSAHLPMLIHGRAKEVMVVGWASGVTVGSVSLYPDVRVAAVEIEPAVIEASKNFAHVNNKPHLNPRVTPVLNDARNYLLVTPRQFDTIISEPSNPWISGASNLFTREFFELGQKHLKEGGIFCQWLQIYRMKPEHLKTLMRTFHQVFPHLFVFETLKGTDLVLLGSLQPLCLDVQHIQEIMKLPRLATDMERVNVSNVDDLLALFRLGTNEIPEFVGKGHLNTDDNALIEFAVPQNLYANTRGENIKEISRHQVSPTAYLRTKDKVDFSP